MNEDFEERYDLDGQMPPEASPGTVLAMVLAFLVSAAFMGAGLWVAYNALRNKDPWNLLGLAAILIALPAWHVLNKAFHRVRDRELYASREWMRQERRVNGYGPHPSAKARRAYR